MTNAKPKTMSHVVTVTPVAVTHSHVDCDISGPTTPDFRVEGGVIFIGEGNACDITFDLQDGAEPDLEWASDPLWIQSNACPRNQIVDRPFRNPTRSSTKMSSVQVDPDSRAGVLHYRMNFRLNGRRLYCDPVIIHD